MSSSQARGLAGSSISPRPIGTAGYCCLHPAEADHGMVGRACGQRNMLHTAAVARLTAAARAGFSHGSFTFPSVLRVRCQPGPGCWPALKGWGSGRGCPGSAGSSLTQTIKHDAVLAMHFVLLFCKPRVYKPTGRRTSSSSRAPPVLLLAAGTSLLHAPELQMGIYCHSFSWLIKENKGKRNQADLCCLLFLFRN